MRLLSLSLVTALGAMARPTLGFAPPTTVASPTTVTRTLRNVDIVVAGQQHQHRDRLFASTTSTENWSSSSPPSPERKKKTTTKKQATSSSNAKPPRELPPVLSDVIALLPPPFSDISPGTIAAKLRGNKPTNPFIKAMAEFIWIPLVFPPWVKLLAWLWWPLHVRMQQSRLGFVGSLLVSSSNFCLTAFPAALLLAVPMLTPTAPENASVAEINAKAMAALAWTRQYAGIFLVGAYLPVPLLMLTSPARLWQTSTLPSLKYWSIAKQSLVFALCLETCYYYMHKLFHWSTCKNKLVKYLNKIHKDHHSGDTRNMHPFDSSRMNQVELIGTVLAIMSGPMLMGLLMGGVHPLLGLGFYSYSIVQAFIAHTGYFTHDGGAHVLHHQRSNCNFGLMGLLDYFHNTSRARSVDLLFSVARMQREMSKKLTRAEMNEITGTISSSGRSRVYQPGQVVVHIGDPAESFFILEEGSCQAMVPKVELGTVDSVVVKEYDEPGQYFGELALLRNQPRAATIRAGPAGCKLAEIPSKEFSVLSNLATTFQEQAASYSKKQESTGEEVIANADAVEYSAQMPQEEYGPGETIIKQGDPGDQMFILEEGTCAAFIDGKEVLAYEKAGDYFGELALLNNEPRKASVVAGEDGATVAIVSRPLFDKMVAFSGDSMRQRASEMY